MKQTLSTILPPPEREAFEREVADIVCVNGTLTTIAQLLQKDLSVVSRAFNPYEPDRHNPFFLSMIYLWALDHINPALGDKIVQMCLRERDKWTPKRTISADPAKETHRVGAELFEAIEAEMCGKDIEVVIKEWCDVEEAVKAKKASAIAQRNRRHFGEAA